MTTTTTPVNREEVIERRARAIMEHVWGDSEPDNVAREIAAATLEADEDAGLVIMPPHLTADQKEAVKAQPHSYMHSTSSMWEAVKAASPYRREG